MLVYGDAEREELPAATQASIAEKLCACERLRHGRAYHEMLVRAFILTGELVQGLADREFMRKGADDLSAVQDAGARLLLLQAEAIGRSWADGLAGDPPLPPDWPQLLAQLHGEEPVRMKSGEGYCFYALYPESYFMAARRSGLGADSVVIGLRSIGTGLAAMVAAGLGSHLVFTLRPIGHPFDRRLAVAPDLKRAILKDGNAHYAVVDEGPGLSGSSFGCVADWLEANGIAADHIHFFPSHPGDLGPQASARHRRRWAGSQRHFISVDDCIPDGSEPTRCLQTWVAELIGAPIQSWQDISGGGWREHAKADPEFRPPSDMAKEKRKFLVGCKNQTWLVKFAGLGEAGAQKARKAALLSEAGLTPGIAGFRHGFLVEHWVPGTSLHRTATGRERIVATIARYLGFRARHLRPQRPGASLQQLAGMAAFNVGEACGEDAASKIRAMIGDPDRFHADIRPIDTDNRLHRWEWIACRDGRILKTDALDHSAAHDLVGCQDVAWDIAGAAVEFDLSVAERDRLAALVAIEAAHETRRELIDLFEIFYLGFQLGLWTDAAAGLGGDEALRTRNQANRYSKRLHELTTM